MPWIIDINALWAIALAGLIWDIILQIATRQGAPTHLEDYYSKLGKIFPKIPFSGPLLGVGFSVLAVVVGLLTAEAILQINKAREENEKRASTVTNY